MARRAQTKVAEENKAKEFYERNVDQDGFEVRNLAGKGRAVFTTSSFEKGQFLLVYGGELLTEEEAEKREEGEVDELLIYRYFFSFNGKCLCYDATAEPEENKLGPKLGRLVNHGYTGERNAKMKMLVVDGTPFLCLFALMDIEQGTEILYD